MNNFKIGLKQEVAIGELLANTTYADKKIIHDLIIAPDGRSTQIDLVFICNKGLFVIESKNYRDTLISGKDTSKVWQVWTTKGQKNFYNPLKQNSTHIDLLSKVLKLPKSKFTSIVVFPDSTNIDAVKKYKGVCTVSNLTEMIAKSGLATLTSDQIQQIATTLQQVKGDKAVRQAHLAKMQQIKTNLRAKKQTK